MAAIKRVLYSEIYFDEECRYMYRDVLLPLKNGIPEGRSMAEQEWKNLGIVMDPNWEHCVINEPAGDPRILLFRSKMEKQCENEEQGTGTKRSSEEDGVGQLLCAELSRPISIGVQNLKKRNHTELMELNAESQLRCVAADASAEQWPSFQSNYSTESTEGPADKRKVCVSNLDVKITENRLFELFSPAGSVRDIKLMVYTSPRGSSRYGYVEFVHPKSVDAAMKLDGKKIDGRPMFVIRHKVKEPGQENKTLFACDLNLNVTVDQLKAVFANCEKLKDVQIPEMESGQTELFGVIEFEDEDSAMKAMRKIDGKGLLGEPVKLTDEKPKPRRQRARSARHSN